MRSRSRRIKTVVIEVGMATHYRPNHRNVTACGIVGAEHQAYDPRDTDCHNCQKTLAYKKVMQK